MLPRLDVFDFSAASLEFTPGTQRPPVGFPNGLTLDGAINVDIVDNSQSTLGLFSFGANVGSLTLGDGGSLGLQLTQPVSTDGPLYLYIGEEGATGETVIGNFQISADTIEPTGDLSTDLGADGPEGDTTGLTYTFTPGAGHTAFSLDVVLFSEELPEFDGVDLTDLYTIKLNGVDIGALSNGAALSIKNLVYGGSGDLIYNPVETGPLADQIKADAYTRTITITGAVNPGEVNTLTIEAKDGRDAFLDSGLLIKDGSFKTFIRPELTVQGSEDGGPLFIGGDCIMLTVSLPPGSVLTEPVTVIATSSPTLDIGNGPGAPMTLTFKPGDPLTQEICVYAAPGTTSEDWGTITYEVVSNDPAINGQQIAPEIFDLEQPAQLAFDGEPRPTWSHDHNSDIIWQDFAGGRGDPLILMGNGEVAAHPVHFSPWPTGVLPLWKIAGVGDFNGDGDSEIIWQHDSNNLASLWIMDETDVLTVGQFGSGGQLPVGAPPVFPYGPFGFGIKAIGDVNGDGTDDVISQQVNGDVDLWLMDGSYSGEVHAKVGPFASGALAGWHVKGSGDFNGDGNADIIWQHDNGQAAMWLMDGNANTTFVGAVGPFNPGADWQIKGVGDFNGDGKDDIVWQHADGQAAMWLMDGTEATFVGAVGPFNPGANWQIQGTGDFNDDGKDDILWQETGGLVAEWHMDGTQTTFVGAVGMSQPGSPLFTGEFNNGNELDWSVYSKTDLYEAVFGVDAHRRRRRSAARLRPLSIEIRRTDGVGLRKELAGHRVADDHDRLAVGDVAVVEQSSLDERNADGLEIARARRLHFGSGQPRRLHLRLTLNANAREKATAVVHRKRPGAAGRTDAGQALPAARSARSRTARGAPGVVYFVKFRATRMLSTLSVRMPASTDCSRMTLRSIKPGADQEHERHRDLRHDERAAERASSGRYRPPAFLNRGRQADRGRAAREWRRRASPVAVAIANGEQQDRSVQRDLLRARRELARQRDEQVHRDRREERARRPRRRARAACFRSGVDAPDATGPRRATSGSPSRARASAAAPASGWRRWRRR